MDPRSGHPDRRTFYLSTAPDSAFQENRLVCSPTSGLLTSLKVLVKSGLLKKTHLWDCKRAYLPGLHFLGQCLHKQGAVSDAQIWHLAPDTKGRCPQPSQMGTRSGHPDRRTNNISTLPTTLPNRPQARPPRSAHFSPKHSPIKCNPGQQARLQSHKRVFDKSEGGGQIRTF